MPSLGLSEGCLSKNKLAYSNLYVRKVKITEKMMMALYLMLLAGSSSSSPF